MTRFDQRVFKSIQLKRMREKGMPYLCKIQHPDNIFDQLQWFQLLIPGSG